MRRRPDERRDLALVATEDGDVALLAGLDVLEAKYGARDGR